MVCTFLFWIALESNPLSFYKFWGPVRPMYWPRFSHFEFVYVNDSQSINMKEATKERSAPPQPRGNSNNP